MPLRCYGNPGGANSVPIAWIAAFEGMPGGDQMQGR
jgi:hypothetical protein